MIIVAGDSHIQQFMGGDHPCRGYPAFVLREPFKCFWLGPKTCWNFMKNCKEMLYQIMEEHENDRLVISCGEIDCRRHVVHHAGLRGVGVDDVAREVAWRYVEIMEEFKDWRPIALGLPPQMEAPQKDYDPRGTVEERNVAIDVFNDEVGKHVPFWPSPGQEFPTLMLDSVHVLGETARRMLVELATETKR